MGAQLPLIVFGAGGHAGAVLSSIRAENRLRVLGLVADGLEPGSERHGHRILGAEDDLGEITTGLSCDNLFVAVGDNCRRQRVTERIAARIPVSKFVTVVHPAACVAPDVALGEGVFVAPGAVVVAGAIVGDGCIINTHSSVDHDARMDAFSSTAPGCAIGGHVVLGARSALGIGACVRHRVSIGPDAVIGAGAAVVDDIPEQVVAYGVPCRVISPRAPDDPHL